MASEVTAQRQGNAELFDSLKEMAATAKQNNEFDDEQQKITLEQLESLNAKVEQLATIVEEGLQETEPNFENRRPPDVILKDIYEFVNEHHRNYKAQDYVFMMSYAAQHLSWVLQHSNRPDGRPQRASA